MKFYEILNHLNNIPKSQNFKVYLIGGVIRDRLLGFDDFKDIDITVEGDFEKFVEYFKIYFAKNIKKELKSNLKTYKFIMDDCFFDLNFTRKEIYPENGMLPQLFKSDIIDDIKRRDFTINSISFDLQNKEFLDPLNGINDLKLKIIKENRKNLFIEDPTRIFRFFKYKTRFNFVADTETYKDLKNSLTFDKLFFNVSKSRISREWLSVLKEKRKKEVIKELYEEKIFDVIFKENVMIDLSGEIEDNDFLFTLSVFYKNSKDLLIKILDTFLNGLKKREISQIIAIKDRKNLNDKILEKYKKILEKN